MFNLNFSNNYKVVHINNELGKCLVGGAGTYMNEMYRYRNSDTGFVYMNLDEQVQDFYATDFMEQRDILIMNRDEAYKLGALKCDILVVQFFELAFCLTEDIIKNKKIVYVIHSVPTPEPPPKDDPFGGHYDIREKFERLCDISDVLVCVSKAEKMKLSSMYPEYEEKIVVIYDGITYKRHSKLNTNYENSRKIFGYIGRMDYRKGILECVREFKNIDAELRIACPKNDDLYLEKILAYIEGAGMQDRVKFYGWCVGERKENFLDSLDALIVPSLYEPFGYVALEAMRRGLPVISSNNGGLDEILEGYKYKYNPYNSGKLAEQINNFISDSNDEVKRQQDILMNNMDRFSANVMVSEYEKLWINIVEDK